jgi:ferredoxin-NADP reductase
MKWMKMLKDFTIYLPDNSEFTFRRCYSYLSEEIDGKTYVMTVDRELKMELSEEDMKWIGVV